jgi:hypothetical protein
MTGLLALSIMCSAVKIICCYYYWLTLWSLPRNSDFLTANDMLGSYPVAVFWGLHATMDSSTEVQSEPLTLLFLISLSSSTANEN